MSVATKNPFALLDAEDDSRPSTPPPAAAPQSPAPTAPARANQRSRGGPARGGNYYSRGGGNKSAPKEQNLNQNGVEEPAEEGQRKFDKNRGRGRGRGGVQRGGRRPFDKHSQTGKTDSDKRIHQSWGGDDGNTELKAAQAADVDAAAESNEWTADAAPAEWGVTPSDADAPPPAAEPEKAEGRPRREKEQEEEENTLTLDQYLARQKEKETIVPKLESTRQANEGDKAWKDVVPLQKDEEDAYFVGKAKTAPKARAKKEEKVYIEIESRFERPERGRGRGGRGGDRGDRGERGRGRGRGGGRGSGRDVTQQPVNVDDQTAFPSLS